MTSIVRLDANEHPIKSVTVFKSNKAEVVRIFKLSLEEGQSKIQIRHLPDSIDTESARVTGLGDAQLFDVVCSIRPGSEEIDSASTAEVVRKLDARKEVLVKDVDTIDDISATMVTYSKSLAGDSVGPKQAELFFENLLSRSRTLTSTRADLEEKILQLERQIDALSSAEKKKQGKTNGEVSMVIMAKKAIDIELRLTYLVQNATWSAAYELHATTEAGVPVPSVSLHYRARITQGTGEDWTDVKLTLSTADMDLSDKAIPVLRPTKIRPPGPVFIGFGADGQGQAQGQVKYKKRGIWPAPAFGQANAVPQASSGAFGQQANLPNTAPTGLFGASAPPPLPLPRSAPAPVHADRWIDVDAEVDVSDGEDEVPMSTIGEPTSVVHESPLALTYHVEGASGVPSDGVPHLVCIAVLPFEAKILHVTVPKVRPVAYLEATVKNTSDYRLLPGAVQAFVDDSFVSKTRIVGDVAPGDVFSCTLGADPATRIRYSRTAKRADDSSAAGGRSAFSEQWAATTFRSRTTVMNRHPFACKLVVRDGVPVSEDEKRVSVVLRHPEGLAEMGQEEGGGVLSAKDCGREGDGEQRVRWSKVVDGKGGKKEGLFEWVVDVEAGEELTIETEWDVKAPVSLRWIESV